MKIKSKDSVNIPNTDLNQYVTYTPNESLYDITITELMNEPVRLAGYSQAPTVDYTEQYTSNNQQFLSPESFYDLDLEELLQVPVYLNVNINDFNAAVNAGLFEGTEIKIPEKIALVDSQQRFLNIESERESEFESLRDEEFFEIRILEPFSFQFGEIIIERLISIAGDSIDPNDGQLSLREAILAANANAGNGIMDRIILAGLPYELTIAGEDDLGFVGDLDITDDLQIFSTNLSFINGNNLDRVFHIHEGVSVEILDVWVQNGSTTGNGGGILVEEGAYLFGNDLDVLNNNAQGDGGGIYVDGGTVELFQTTVYENQATNGGGIATANGGVFVSTISTISSNEAINQGGGIFNDAGGTSEAFNSTVAFNTAEFGGGVANNNSGTLETVSTIIAANTVGNTGADISGGNILSQGYNLIGETLGIDFLSSALQMTDILNVGAAGADLQPLQDIRGDMVHDIGENSLAIDNGSNPLNLRADQTADAPRSINQTDIGAVEFIPTNTIVVSNTSDSATLDGTLRKAILDANETPEFEIILLDAGTYELTLAGADDDLGLTGDLDFHDNMIIRGAGIDQTFISQATVDRVMHIVGEETFVTFQDLTIMNGEADYGGGIYNEGRVQADRVAVVDNHANIDGGGVYLAAGARMLTHTLSPVPPQTDVAYISGNSAGNRGGGIFIERDAEASSSIGIINTIISDNTANEGAGIYNRGLMEMIYSLVAYNTATTLGGGIVNEGPAGENSIIGVSTISNNHSMGDAGGLVSIDNSIIILGLSTVAGNSANGIGDGLLANTGAIGLTENIIANNDGDNDVSGMAFFSLGFNYIANLGSAPIAASFFDQFNLGTGPLELGPLADNGGSFLTHALGPTSVAINAGLPIPPIDAEFDARGNLVTIQDIGAFERFAFDDDTVISIVDNLFGTINGNESAGLDIVQFDAGFTLDFVNDVTFANNDQVLEVEGFDLTQGVDAGLVLDAQDVLDMTDKDNQLIISLDDLLDSLHLDSSQGAFVQTDTTQVMGNTIQTYVANNESIVTVVGVGLTDFETSSIVDLS